MLARGLLCRLAADASKTSTQNLPQLARLIHRSVLSRNASSVPAIQALSRALNNAIVESRRTYAISTKATEPTSTVKRAVKKAASTKTKKTTKTGTRKRSTTSKATTKKAAPKKKAAAKKPKKKAAPKARATKKRTPEQKAAEKRTTLIRELKKKALKEPHPPRRLSALNVFIAEATAGSEGNATGALTTAVEKFKALSPAEREHYNHLANERSAARLNEYNTWVHSYTVEQIHQANLARRHLKRIFSDKEKIAHTDPIKDDRRVKKAATGYSKFVSERASSGDFTGIKVTERFKLISNEWKALTADQKKAYSA
ncbi:hypothetical protein M011DRAFT_478078 [Sporormia fimetaria CBS 119925]|uniref:HMG box domain-containing protein n=1 Tax=Sporormia fimetaria CBS 119925 TaxID=1340428 RepID=A0A6A6VAY7_9PLEO|nr:hypothetical protein M011DRAFT_478078 [Sporormia fimetaria CBS 119925]